MLSVKKKTTQLKDRFEYLKAWLKLAENDSAVASGTQEEDRELRRLIGDLCVVEQVNGGRESPSFLVVFAHR